MKTTIRLGFMALCLGIFSNLHASLLANTEGYLVYHYDIKVAMEEEDYKKAKSLVQSLIQIIESDIAYTSEAIAEEEDEYIIDNLSKKIERQEEIQTNLREFLDTRKKNLAGFNSLDTIRELRRLSIKPKER